jgi:cellulose synthase/poly-beta-1,6-N-acetylglucosamine synthase-like glycosyltransferase/peptidoglycan/xylan/chitin deacetylase (PgdA/CDA1 family)/spore germination protein YaaH
MPHSKQIFFDPDRKRWRRLRWVLDTSVIVITLLGVFFVATIIRGSSVPGVLLPGVKKPYHALKESQKRKPPRRQNTHRKTKRPASQVVLNSDEGIRGAFYVQWDAASFASLKEYYPQIDLLFPEWMHVLTADGKLQAVTELNTLYDVMDSKGKPRPVDERVMPFLKGEKAVTEVLPLVNNFDPLRNEWQPDITAKFMADPAARQRFRTELMNFLATDQYKGLTLDIEAFPESSRGDYHALVQELYGDLHAKGLKLYIAVPVNDKTFDYSAIAQISDGLILMNYDQHYPGGDSGPVAGQDWFLKNLQDALKVIPREKIICAVGNYGYDWAMKKGQKKGTPPASVHTVSVQDAWLEAEDAETDVNFDDDAMNPHFAYLDDSDVRHDVWFLDGVTLLNQMRAAHSLGIYTFALWRLGSEDRSLWAVWDKPFEATAPAKLGTVPPGQDVDIEGQGEVLRIASRPASGERTITVDPNTNLVSDEVFKTMPSPYEVDMYGGTSQKKVAITFDDGPDPTWTPRILDVLKEKNVKATFFLIGLEVEKYPSIAKRIYKEGHEIGNHTFTHPDISNISKRYFEVELNLTERLFEGKLGVKPVLFRPPYSIDQEPDTADQVRPLELSQDMGFITVGDKIDPNDWRENPRRSADEIVADVFANLPPCQPGNLSCGNIILLHDGGGNRNQTVKALGTMIDGLRARGYEIVPVSDLLGKTRAEVMPPLSTNERWAAWVDGLSFGMFGLVSSFIIFVFFVGDVLMSGRLVLVGTLAIFDRFHRRKSTFDPNYQPAVAVLVPAYNEAKVIERTVRSVLDSDYQNLRVIVIDDGSKDATLEVTRAAFQKEIAAGRVTVLTKPNSGKADALNFGLEQVTEELFVGIDADTLVAPDAISKLVPHFSNPRVAAMAGNAKVGNRVNLWTRWQALEYITSQNFERRALNTLNAVSVVPGAIGAWRTAPVRAAGGYQHDTVAEDADLTMALLQAGYWVNYEDRALAYTEAPTKANGLMRQRFRWSFGIMQAVWKHRAAVKQKGALGWVAIPNMVIFQILLPLVSPFIDIMFVAGAAIYFVDKYRHPESANPADFHKLVVYFALFMVIDFIASTIAFTLERQRPGGKRDFLLLGHVWLQRFAYRQLFSLVLIKTLKRAMEGGGFAWDKLERTASVRQPIAVRREREAH